MPPFPAPPPQWPFEPRCPQAPITPSEGIFLPGLGGGWSLEAPKDLPLPQAETELPAAYGRGGVLRAGALVLRPYRRGGLVRFVNRRIYASPARFRQELEVHRALWAAGFPTVEPLGIAHRKRGWGVEGVLLTRYAEGSPWPKCWDHPAISRSLPEAIGALVSWGLWCPDLNATNVMVGPQGLLLLDWDKAEWTQAPGLQERYRERLERSLHKLGAPQEILRAFEKPTL